MLNVFRKPKTEQEQPVTTTKPKSFCSTCAYFAADGVTCKHPREMIKTSEDTWRAPGKLESVTPCSEKNASNDCSDFYDKTSLDILQRVYSGAVNIYGRTSS
jgi:hypothetical protein